VQRRDESVMFWMIGCSPWFLEGVRLNCRGGGSTTRADFEQVGMRSGFENKEKKSMCAISTGLNAKTELKWKYMMRRWRRDIKMKSRGRRKDTRKFRQEFNLMK
jgi:hypothetical protein